MIDLYFWPTPNGQKIAIALEELGLPYTMHPLNIMKGEQFAPQYLAMNPNNKMPTIVDHAPADSDGPLSVFESGAILTYLAEKTGRLGGKTLRERTAVNEWVFWQVGGLGPMLGQANHFVKYASEKIPYAVDRYNKEALRLAGVMERRLSQTRHLAGDEFTIADIAAYAWSLVFHDIGTDLSDKPSLIRWLAEVRERPGVVRGMAVGSELKKPLDDAAKKVLFGTK
jgi:GSH-dependent disulfide-bond oxidoreductase